MAKIPPSNNPVKPQNRGRKYRGQPSYAIPVWNGILEHRAKIGAAIWEFLWCLDKITIEDEHGIGWLLGKTAIDTKRVARDLNEHPDTAYDNLNKLAEQGYLVRKRTRRGYVIGVVNSKKFHVFRFRSDSEKTPNHTSDDSEKTPNHDSEETPNHGGCDSEKTPSVIRRKLLVEETVQEDKAVQTDKTTRGDSTAARLSLSPEIQKLVSELEQDLTGQLSGCGWHQYQTEPELHSVRESFETQARDLGIHFKQIGDLYVEAMAKVRKNLEPAEVILHTEPYTQADLDSWDIDPDCIEVIREPGELLLRYEYGSTQVSVGQTEPFWHAYDRPEVIEQMMRENAAMPASE